MTVARTGAHQCAVDDGSGSSSDCDCASAAAVATAAAASSTSAASFCCCLPAGASPLYTVCRHTHAYTHTHAFMCVFQFSASISLLCMYHTHSGYTRTLQVTHTHGNIQFMHAPVCVSCLPTRRVCNVKRAEQRSDQTQTKVGSGSDSDCGRAARQPLQAATASA